MSSVRPTAYHDEIGHNNWYKLNDYAEYIPGNKTTKSLLKNKTYTFKRLNQLKLKNFKKSKGQTGNMWFIQVDLDANVVLCTDDDEQDCDACASGAIVTGSVEFGMQDFPPEDDDESEEEDDDDESEEEEDDERLSF